MTVPYKKIIILNDKQIGQKITRIAHEILEHNFKEKSLILMGIQKEGFALAEKIIFVLTKISDIDITLYHISVDKENSLSFNIKPSNNAVELNDKVIILVDDVLNSGKTLVYATKFILEHPLKGLQVACLVDRKHREFPIRADYVGLTLSTTLKEHITVTLGQTSAVYLD